MPKALFRPVVALALLALGLGAGRTSSAEPAKTLLLTIWSNYMPTEVLEGFEKEAGCKVEIPSTYGSNDELLAKLQTKKTGFDLAVPSDVILPVLVAEGLIERVDAARTPNRKHLDPAFAARASDAKGEWSVPYTWGTVGIAWRTDRVPGEVDSWGVFGTDRAKGNAYLLEEARDGVAAALLYKGKDLNSVDPKDLAEAKAALLAWRPHLKGFTGEVKDTLVSGEGWLLQAYNGDVAQAMKERQDLRFVVPKEGGILWVDVFVIPKGAPHADLAHAFLDYLMRPEVAAKVSEGIRYAVCNQDAVALLPKEIRDDPVIYAPEDVRKRCHQERDLGKDLPKVVDLWTEVRAGD